MSQPRNDGLAAQRDPCAGSDHLQPATLQVDAVFTLVGAGGNLGERALDQAPFWKVFFH